MKGRVTPMFLALAAAFAVLAVNTEPSSAATQFRYVSSKSTGVLHRSMKDGIRSKTEGSGQPDVEWPGEAVEEQELALAGQVCADEQVCVVQDRAYKAAQVLRWGWWFAVVYFFWASAEVCDAYLMPTLEVISDNLQVSDDVAGATIMAFGCNSPELFLNVISIWVHSDIGTGAVLGGVVFNLMVLCGCALIATPRAYMPLRIDMLPFVRDVVFSAYSIFFIWNFISRPNMMTSGKDIELWDCLLLLGSGMVYSCCVVFTAPLKRLCSGRRTDHSPATSECDPCEASPPRRDELLQSESFDDPLRAVPNPGPKEGATLLVRVQHANRMVDRSRYWDSRFMTITVQGLVVSTELMPSASGHVVPGKTFYNGQWRHAGLVNAPGALGKDNTDAPSSNSRGGSSISAESRPAKSWSQAASKSIGTLAQRASRSIGGRGQDSPRSLESNRDPKENEAVSELVPTRDFVSCVPPVDPDSTRFELMVVQRESTFGKILRLEFDCGTPEMRERWVAAVMQNMQDEQHTAGVNLMVAAYNPSMPSWISHNPRSTHRGTTTPFASKSCLAFVLEWADWFRHPVRSVLQATIPDVHKPHLRRWYPVSFVMCLLWLAIFAFCVTQICLILHEVFGVSTAVLGFLIAAIGTSFPNVISCVGVSQQGRTGMAIANALGANIQNIFLALGLPWTIIAINEGIMNRLEQTNLLEVVVWMSVSLGLLVATVLLSCCRVPKWPGYIFLAVFAYYFVSQIAQEINGCLMQFPPWPWPCQSS